VIILPTTTELEFITRNTSDKTANASIIWLHGLGADCYDFSPIVQALNLPPNLHCRFIFPNAPTRNITINGGFPCRAWYDIYSLNRLEEEDITGVHASETGIAELIKREHEHGIPYQRIILAGFSQGGAMALYTGLRYQHSLAGILALSCYLPLSSSHSIENNEHNKRTAILQMHGKNDNVLPFDIGKQTHHYLTQHQFNATFKALDTGHEVSADQITGIRQWIIETLT
jgi:phospholipase/carboxylesterase